MKLSLVLAYALLATGVAAAVALAFAPELTERLDSGPTVKGPGSAEAAGIVMLLIAGAMAVVAVVTALLAWFAARHAQAGSALRWSCWLPIVVAALAARHLYSRVTAT